MTTKQKPGVGAWGPWIAMAAAVILTAKGEFDLAVLAHFSAWIAWMFPVMVDVYVITSFHRRRWMDMVIGMLLMIFCQIAVHLVPVYITAGEQTPWRLVVAVACIAPVVVVRVKFLTGKTAAEIAAEQQAAQRTDELRAALEETAGARRALAETQASAATTAEQARAEIAGLVQAETQASQAREQAEIRAEQAEALAATQAAQRAEMQTRAQAEIREHARVAAEAQEAAELAQQARVEQAELARLAEGRLAEAREAADRANTVRVHAEQQAHARIQQVTSTAEQAEQGLRQQLAETGQRGEQAERQAAELGEQLRVVNAQLEQAQQVVERQTRELVLVEQQAATADRDHMAALGEAHAARDAALAEAEQARRAASRAAGKAESMTGQPATGGSRRPAIGGRRHPAIAGRRSAEIVLVGDRHSLPALPQELAADLPEVETVAPETVALVLTARIAYPDATQPEIAEVTGKSERTVRKVLTAVPTEQLLALSAGRAA